MIEEVIEKLPKTSFIDAKVALTDIYETTSGIWNHLDNQSHKAKQRPLASVALHEVESITKDTELYGLINKYLEEGIYKETGLDLESFLNLPREFITLIFEKVTAMKAKSTQQERDIISSMNNPKTKK